MKKHSKMVKTSPNNLFGLLDPGVKSLKNHGFLVEKSFNFFPKKCLDFSDPMFKILQNPQKSGGRKNKKNAGSEVTVTPPPTVTEVTPP